MYITAMINRTFITVLITFAAVLCASGELMAQDGHVEPIRQTRLSAVQTDLSAYMSGGFSKCANLWTANNFAMSDKKLQTTFLDVGAAVEVYNTKFKWVRFNGSLGYKYQVYSYKMGTNSGVYTHWLTLDANTTFKIFYMGFAAGVKSDIYLNSRIKNNDHFTYEGLYGGCFNDATFCCYGGFFLQYTRFKAEVRCGGYIVPQLNPQRISYYNMNKTYVDGLYFEVRVLYRIFTTGKNTLLKE